MERHFGQQSAAYARRIQDYLEQHTQEVNSLGRLVLKNGLPYGEQI